MPTIKTYSSAWREQRVKIQEEQAKKQAESEARRAATTKRGAPKADYTQIETRTTEGGKTIKVAVSAKQKKHKIYVAYKTPSGQVNVRGEYVSKPIEGGAYQEASGRVVGISTSVRSAKTTLLSHEHEVRQYEKAQVEYEQAQAKYEAEKADYERQVKLKKAVETKTIPMTSELKAASAYHEHETAARAELKAEQEKTQKLKAAIETETIPMATELKASMPKEEAPVEVHIKKEDIPSAGLASLFPDTGPVLSTTFIVSSKPSKEVIAPILKGTRLKEPIDTRVTLSPGEGPPPSPKEYPELVGQYGVGRDYLFGYEMPRVTSEGHVEGKLIFPATPPKGPAPSPTTDIPPDYSALTPTPRLQIKEGDVVKVREYKFGEGATTGVLTVVSAEREWKVGEGAGMRSIVQGPTVSPEHQARAIMGGWTDTYTTTPPPEDKPLPPMTVSKDTVTGQILGVAETLKSDVWTVGRVYAPIIPALHATGVALSIGASAVEAGAGFVGAFESLGDILGRPNIPDLPGTALTATTEGYRGMTSYAQRELLGGKVFVGSGAEDVSPYVVSQEPRREAEFFIRHPTYGVGAVVGEVALGLGLGKLIEATAWRLGFGAKLSRAMPQSRGSFEPASVRTRATVISTPLTEAERAAHAYRISSRKTLYAGVKRLEPPQPKFLADLESPLPATQTISRARHVSVSGKVRSVSEVEYEKLLQTRQTAITTIGPEEVIIRTPAGEMRTLAIAKVRTPITKIMESIRTGRYGYKFEPIRSSIRESKVLAEADFYRHLAVSDIERISSEVPTVTSTGRLGELADVRVAAAGGEVKAGRLAVSAQTGRRTFELAEISHTQVKGTLTDPFNVKVTTGGKVEAVKPPKVEAVKPEVVQPPKKVGPRLPKREGDPFALDKAEVRLDSRTSGITREEIVKAEQEAAGFQLEGHIHQQVAVAETVPVGVSRMQRLPLPYTIPVGYTTLGTGGASLVKSMAASSGVLISPWDAQRMGAPLAVAAPSYMISEAAQKKRRKRTQQVLVTKTIQDKAADQKQIEIAKLKKSMLMTPALKYAMEYTFGPVTTHEAKQEAGIATILRSRLAVKPQTIQRQRTKVATITAQKVGVSTPKLTSLQAQKARAAETAKLKATTMQKRLQALSQTSTTALISEVSLKGRLKQASLGKTISKQRLRSLTKTVSDTKTLTGPKTLLKTKLGAETKLGTKTISGLKEGLALKTGVTTTPVQKTVTLTTPVQAQLTDVDVMQKQVTKEKTEAKQKLKVKLTGVPTDTTGKGGLFPGGIGILPALGKRMKGGRRGEDYFERLHAVRGPRDVLIGEKRRRRKR